MGLTKLLVGGGGAVGSLSLRGSQTWVSRAEMGRRRRRKRRAVEVTRLCPHGLEGRAFSLIFSTVCFSSACWLETLNMKITQCSENSPSSYAAAVH